MPRRWQRSPGGFLHGKPRSQLISMITLLIVLSLIYARAKDPQTWRWLAQDAAAESEPPRVQVADLPPSEPARGKKPAETVVPAATDRDPAEAEEVLKQFAAVSDRAPLSPPEMPAYWRLMKWARAQTFDDLSRRAKGDVPFTQLWEQPDKYRGKPLRLRLHIKRILEYEAPQNSVGVERVYEAWGWTEDSKSYPYVVVFSELPPGMRVGSDVQEEGVFVGYFLKTMSYVAFEKNRVAPLLVGRIRSIDRPKSGPAGADNQLWFWGAGVVLLFVVGVRIWIGLSRRRQGAPAGRKEAGDETFEDWLSKSPPTEPPSDKSTTRDATTM